MNWRQNKMFFFSPDDGGGKGDEVVNDEDLSDGDDTVVEDDKSKRRENYNLRKGKSNAEIKAINTKLETLETNLNKLMTLIGDNSQTDKTTNGKLNPEENQAVVQISELKSTIQSFITNVDDRFKKMDARSEADRTASFRRELLKEAGASSDFVHYVDQGVINIPEHLFDDFDALDKFMDRLGGIKRNQQTTQQTSAADQTTTRQVKSVPHKKDEDTAAVHNDKGRTDLAGALDGINSEIDKILDGTKAEGGKGIPKDSLTKMFELAEKGDAILGGSK